MAFLDLTKMGASFCTSSSGATESALLSESLSAMLGCVQRKLTFGVRKLKWEVASAAWERHRNERAEQPKHGEVM